MSRMISRTLAGLSYKQVTDTELTNNNEPVQLEANNYKIVADVCDLSKGHIGVFKKLSQWLIANHGKVDALELNRGAEFIRQADLYGACQFLLEHSGYNFDAAPYIDAIVQSGVPGGMSFAGLGDVGTYALIGVAIFLLANNNQSRRSKTRAGW